MKHLRVALTLMIALLLAVPAFADEGSQREAEKLLSIINASQMMSQTMDQMLDLQIQQNPQLQPYKEVIKEFLDKYMSFESIKPDLVKLYADSFTEAELKDINTFYVSPTGQKAVMLMPELMSKGAKLGTERVQAHSEELRQMIEAESAKINAQQVESQPNAPQVESQPNASQVEPQPNAPQVESQPNAPQVESQPNAPQVEPQPAEKQAAKEPVQ